MSGFGIDDLMLISKKMKHILAIALSSLPLACASLSWCAPTTIEASPEMNKDHMEVAKGFFEALKGGDKTSYDALFYSGPDPRADAKEHTANAVRKAFYGHDFSLIYGGFNIYWETAKILGVSKDKADDIIIQFSHGMDGTLLSELRIGSVGVKEGRLVILSRSNNPYVSMANTSNQARKVDTASSRTDDSKPVNSKAEPSKKEESSNNSRSAPRQSPEGPPLAKPGSAQR
jgi:hypothetical protein